MGVTDILARMVQIAHQSRGTRARTAAQAKPARHITSDCDEASAIANRTRQPVDFMHGARQCTIWPIGTTPPL